MPGMMGWSKPNWLIRDHPSFGIFNQPSGLSGLQDRADASKKISSGKEASARGTRTGRRKRIFFCNSSLRFSSVSSLTPCF